MSLCWTHKDEGFCYACELTKLRERYEAVCAKLANTPTSEQYAELELQNSQLRSAIRYFKEHEHDEKRGQALRGLWTVLDSSSTNVPEKSAT